MRTLEESLTQYAAYHRDRRNLATHFAGVPMIVFSLVVALATVTFPAGSVVVTGSAILSIAVCAWYLKLDLGLGVAMAAIFFLLCAGASEMTHRLGTGQSLAWALALFVVGWALQFWGHKFEGVKPAFFDDVRQIFVAPIFLAAEACFAFGARQELRRYVEDRVGPTVPRRDGRALPIEPQSR